MLTSHACHDAHCRWPLHADCQQHLTHAHATLRTQVCLIPGDMLSTDGKLGIPQGPSSKPSSMGHSSKAPNGAAAAPPHTHTRPPAHSPSSGSPRADVEFESSSSSSERSGEGGQQGGLGRRSYHEEAGSSGGVWGADGCLVRTGDVGELMGCTRLVVIHCAARCVRCAVAGVAAGVLSGMM